MDILSYRTKNGLSQSEFAALLTDPPATQGVVSHWETGHCTITAERAIQIEKITGGEIHRSDLRPDFWPPAVPKPAKRRKAA